MNIKSKSGFTIVEILIVVLISTVVFAGIYSTFIVGNNAWGHYNESIAVKKEARRALVGMVNELREAENMRVIQNIDGSSVYFYRPSVGTVSYVWSNKGLNANMIIRQNRANQRILAQNISKLAFNKFKDVVFIEITASKVTDKKDVLQIALREKVALRAKTPLFTR